MSELGIKESVEKNCKKTFNPNENFLTDSDAKLTSGERKLKESAVEVKVDIETLKALAKNYFYSIGDTEMASAVDSPDRKIRGDALKEAGEKCPELGRMLKEYDEKLIKKVEQRMDKLDEWLKERGYK